MIESMAVGLKARKFFGLVWTFRLGKAILVGILSFNVPMIKFKKMSDLFDVNKRASPADLHKIVDYKQTQS